MTGKELHETVAQMGFAQTLEDGERYFYRAVNLSLSRICRLFPLLASLSLDAREGDSVDLAEKDGAGIAASRPMVDDGIVPYEYQVGLTGKTVSPEVYVAFGISGAVQHTVAISGAKTVIAVNTDRDARIFDYSDYGIVEDIRNLFKEK